MKARIYFVSKWIFNQILIKCTQVASSPFITYLLPDGKIYIHISTAPTLSSFFSLFFSHSFFHIVYIFYISHFHLLNLLLTYKCSWTVKQYTIKFVHKIQFVALTFFFFKNCYETYDKNITKLSREFSRFKVKNINLLFTEILFSSVMEYKIHVFVSVYSKCDWKISADIKLTICAQRCF